MRQSLRHSLVPHALVVGVLGTSPVMGNSFGPFPGFSGGPTASGQSCTFCHGYASGPGFTEVLGLPSAYVPGEIYNLSVRVADATQVGAGFELGVEAGGQFVGTIIITDPINTQLLDDGQHTYVAQTLDGMENSIADWQQAGGMADFNFSWQAPAQAAGPIGFYAAGNAVDNDFTSVGDTVYLSVTFVEPFVGGDGDEDGDVDFSDFAALQECFDTAPLSDGCGLVDLDAGGTIDLDDYDAFFASLTGPTAQGPLEYRNARSGRGARLYDKWWIVNGAPTPTGNHPLYPAAGQQSGNATFRCKECHGWDYKGVDGAYGSGSHFTGIRGVFGTQLTSHQIFDLLKNDTAPNGHGFGALGLTDSDIWDLTKFLREHLVDTDVYIDATGAFIGDHAAGVTIYELACLNCHGPFGQDINFGTPENPEFLGDVANHNPWELLHKVRAGQPGHPMPSFIELVWDAQVAADVGTRVAEFPAG